MIYLLADRYHETTIKRFVNQWAPHLRGRIELVSYGDMLGRRRFRRGTFVFLTQRPTTTTRAFLANAALQIRAAGGRVLNPLDRTLGRYDLLIALQDAGINDFRAYRLDELEQIERFPVFVRPEHLHTGNLSGLLRSRDELRAAADAIDESTKRDGVVATEYVDTADSSGVYRKYSVFRIGDRFIPRHVLFSKDWVTKGPDLDEQTMIEEEKRYLDSNPHDETLRRVFEIAQIDYGRIDYAVVDGGIRVWEINMNPSFAPPILRVSPDRAHFQIETMNAITSAVEALDTDDSGFIRLDFDSKIQREAGVRVRHHAARWTARLLRRCGLSVRMQGVSEKIERLGRYDG